MLKVEEPMGLLDFLRDYLDANNITHHGQVRTDDLAGWFRAWFQVPAFARLTELEDLCARLGVPVHHRAVGSDELLAVNMWYDGAEPTIVLRPDGVTVRLEHSLCHELREVIENGFKRVKPEYVGIDTNDNKAMNPESDQFASCLLMPPAESKQLLRSLGYDLLAFAHETSRALPSIILRTQHLLSSKSEEGPAAGIWLYETPWELVRQGRARPSDLVVRYDARLRGFSLDKNATAETKLARLVFPGKQARAMDAPIVLRAVAEGRTVLESIRGFDLWGERDFEIICEPLFVKGAIWRVLLAAVRRDCLDMIQPWMDRINGPASRAAVSLGGASGR